MLDDDTSSWSALQALLRDAGIDDSPAFSRALRDALREEIAGVHASIDLETSPDDLDGWGELLVAEERDTAVCGFTGYGIQSTFFILHWRQGPVALLSRSHFGALSQADDDARRVSGLIGLANGLMQRAADRFAAGQWPDNQVLMVVDDEIGESGWCWVTAARPLAEQALDTGLGMMGAFVALDALTPANKEG